MIAVEGGAAGAALLLTSPKNAKNDTPRAAVFVGPASIGAAGSF
jgi:hypothetical protein